MNIQYKNFEIPNRLIDEKSPYLLQHAHNPVDWYPWCDEAFTRAGAENKPVFLSVGYSTCHWCHVMAHESFEDEDVARILNDEYISVKVDREERPDIDSVYMSACQAMTGGGGWPMTIIMTPDQKPFFAGTYFPKNSRLNMPGLTDILNRIAHAWKTKPNEILMAADNLTDHLKSGADETGKDVAYSLDNPHDSKEMIKEAAAVYCSIFDRDNGGFGKAPKFPSAHNLMFLLKYADKQGDHRALSIIEKTLSQMYRGGLFDHVGYGFARYSTDEKWLAPHFEKMLYDNALLIMAYADAFEATRNQTYKSVAQKVMSYIRREMTDESGGFYSAQDADSEGEEGKFYTFTPKEIEKVLTKQDADYFSSFYDVTENGNFEGKNILNLLKNENWESEDIRIEKMIPKIYNYRAGRMSLHKDDKILTSWNALMIAAFARAYKVFKDEKYLQFASDGLGFIWQNMMSDDGRLLARYKEGKAGIPGYLDDYAFLTFALIQMFEVTKKTEYLIRAKHICDEMIKLFWDRENGGFYIYGNDVKSLITRPKEFYDGAMPSGNSVAAYVLVKLAILDKDDTTIGEIAYKQISACKNAAALHPAGHSFLMLALIEEAYTEHEQTVYACGPLGCTPG